MLLDRVKSPLSSLNFQIKRNAHRLKVIEELVTMFYKTFFRRHCRWEQINKGV